MANVLVIGAGGGVGLGIAQEFLRSGHRVAAVARRPESLAEVRTVLANAPGLMAIAGSVEDETHAEALRDRVLAAMPQLDAVIVSVNAARQSVTLLEQSSAWLLDTLRQNVASHFVAARTFIPALAPGGLYLAMGGASADFVWPHHGHISLGQAALRMMMQVIAQESSSRDVRVRELLIGTIVASRHNEAQADPQWLTSSQIGARCVDIFSKPDAYPGPILRIPD